MGLCPGSSDIGAAGPGLVLSIIGLRRSRALGGRAAGLTGAILASVVVFLALAVVTIAGLTSSSPDTTRTPPTELYGTGGYALPPSPTPPRR
ncbi:hypothetical protein [Pseudonocardia sp. HH130630-07]|uniref:hypothetical protein n=1 Tax=Pseudonocardia sp. HH130630-07 TaxID=1690815 RepID=UPI00081502D0|nr:hypothetical protein [Pseudonocardia sp. HH130630-07]ANY10830.1 hypothetical protein AFB00_31040 [Pseudonocardia sp. HH130630-07]